VSPEFERRSSGTNRRLARQWQLRPRCEYRKQNTGARHDVQSEISGAAHCSFTGRYYRRLDFSARSAHIFDADFHRPGVHAEPCLPAVQCIALCAEDRAIQGGLARCRVGMLELRVSVPGVPRGMRRHWDVSQSGSRSRLDASLKGCRRQRRNRYSVPGIQGIQRCQ
jgi:hypothetical protein